MLARRLRCVTASGGRGLRATMPISRFLSAGNSESVDKKPDAISFFETNKNRLTTAVYAGAGLAVTYGFYELTYSFLSLTPALSLKYGFFGGALSTGVIAATLFGVDGYIHTKPDTAFTHAAHFAATHKGLKDALGGSIKIQSHSDAKTYKTNAGYFSVLSFRTPSVELLFKAKGSNNAVATIFVRSRHNWIFRRAIIDYVAADIAKPGNPTKQRMVLMINTAGGGDYNDNFNALLRQAKEFSG